MQRRVHAIARLMPKPGNMQCLCNISRKNWDIKLMLCMLINKKDFYKLILLFLLGWLVRHVQSTQASLWHLKKEVRNEVWDLAALAALKYFLCNILCNVLSSLNLFFSQYGILLFGWSEFLAIVLSYRSSMQVGLFQPFWPVYVTFIAVHWSVSFMVGFFVKLQPRKGK